MITFFFKQLLPFIHSLFIVHSSVEEKNISKHLFMMTSINIPFVYIFINFEPRFISPVHSKKITHFYLFVTVRKKITRHTKKNWIKVETLIFLCDLTHSSHIKILRVQEWRVNLGSHSY